MCGNMITVLWGKTAGSIYMAGCIDNIRKECNMTPKQWYDMGESVIQVPGCERKEYDVNYYRRFSISNSCRRGPASASGGRASSPWARTER